MDYNHFFNFYGYGTQDGWTGREKQLKDAGLDTSGIEIVNGKGVSNNGQYAQYNEKEGEYMPYSEQLASLGIDESEYGLVFGKGYGKNDEEHEQKTKILTFTAEEDNSSIYLTCENGNCTFQYSLDNGKTWDEWREIGYSHIWETINLNRGESVCIKGDNYESMAYDNGYDYDYGHFHMTGKISASGDVTSLYNGTGGDIDFDTDFVGGGYLFTELFKDCTSLIKAPNIPLTRMQSHNDCRSMFEGCTSLTTAPEELPAMTLTGYCYNRMFYGCTSLVEAPVLPATQLVNNCYNGMFSGCTSLNKVTCLATDISASQCTKSWLYGVSETGEFTKASSMSDWSTGIDGIPSGWTVENL